MIVFWGLIIWGIIALVRYLSGNRQNGSPNNSALEILKSRYAHGEINKEEFEEKKKALI
jgi:putative membrane protein